MNKPKKTPVFRGGINIAIKIPKVHFEKTVAFYRDVLGLPVVKEEDQLTGPSYSCRFGPNKLWFDQFENYSQTDIWLDLETDDIEGAMARLREHDIPVRDELEPLPGEMNGHWISSPAGTVHLLLENPELKEQ